MVAQVSTTFATWLNVPAFCDQVKAGFRDNIDPFFDYAEARTLVVMDDVFGRDLTNYEAGQVLARLIDMAYQNNAACLFTMNQDVQALGGRLPSHEVSRILANATVLAMSADKDWRRVT